LTSHLIDGTGAVGDIRGQFTGAPSARHLIHTVRKQCGSCTTYETEYHTSSQVTANYCVRSAGWIG
jgi:hypothetical protein